MKINIWNPNADRFHKHVYYFSVGGSSSRPAGFGEMRADKSAKKTCTGTIHSNPQKTLPVDDVGAQPGSTQGSGGSPFTVKSSDCIVTTCETGSQEQQGRSAQTVKKKKKGTQGSKQRTDRQLTGKDKPSWSD